MCPHSIFNVPGCTEATACNYNAEAEVDDGSCTYAADGYDCAGNCLSGEAVIITLTDSYGDTWNGGSLMVNGVGYDQPTEYDGWGSGTASDSYDACIDLSTCNDVTYTAGSYSHENSWQITDASGQVLASGAAHSGTVGYCPGCTDESALNFDADATEDDGSCTYGDD